MLRRMQFVIALVGCVGVLFAAGTAGAAAVPHGRPAADVRLHAVARPATAAATAAFLLHAGLAYYAFDHYIWKPYKAGDLHGFTHVFTIAKAGLAAIFVYHEVKLMAADVKRSKLLTFLAAPVAVAIAKLGSLKSAISGGKLTAIGGVQSELGAIEKQSGAKGIVIKEIVHAL